MDNCKCWRGQNKNFGRHDKAPKTLESLQAAWDRDQELIFEMKDEISGLKQKVNKLTQKQGRIA